MGQACLTEPAFEATQALRSFPRALHAESVLLLLGWSINPKLRVYKPLACCGFTLRAEACKLCVSPLLAGPIRVHCLQVQSGCLDLHLSVSFEPRAFDQEGEYRGLVVTTYVYYFGGSFL